MKQSEQNASLGTRIAAIDVGSNAIRLAIGERTRDGSIKVIKKNRESVRLGKDVFTTGALTDKTVLRSLQAFIKFKAIMNDYGVVRYRAVGTSALREANNSATLLDPLKRRTGIDLEIIDGITEGQLIFDAVADRVDLKNKKALLIDIGGGSVEFSSSVNEEIQNTQSFPLGGVRILELMRKQKLKERHLLELIQTALIPAQAFLRECMRSGEKFDFAVGTGGNFEALGRLRVTLLSKTSLYGMTDKDLREVTDHLMSMSVKQRVQFLKMKPDRADVVVPAALLTLEVMRTVAVSRLAIPFIGLREGILSSIGEAPKV